MTKEQRLEILNKGILENGGNKANKQRRIAVDKIILDCLKDKFTWVTVSTESAATLKTYMYNRLRGDSELKKRSYSFRYMNSDGTDGPIVTSTNGAQFGSPCVVKITRNDDKSDADMSLREMNKRHKALEKKAALSALQSKGE